MNLLLTGAWAQAKEHIPELEAMGHSIAFLQHEADALPCAPEWPEGIVCNGLFLHHPIERFTRLRYLQLTSAGYDRVDLDYVRAHGIGIRNARGVYGIPMAEFAVAGVLQLYKQSRFFWMNQARHRWEKHRGLLELCGRRVLIVGCGDVGSLCAERFRAFGCRVEGVDAMPREDARFDAIRGTDALDGLLPEADVVVLTVPLTGETRGMFGRARLDRLRHGAVLVSLSRGGVLDEGALAERLDTLGGAVLDVFGEEPLPAQSPLWDRENVLITPHNSFVGDGNGERLWNVIRDNLRGFHG